MGSAGSSYFGTNCSARGIHSLAPRLGAHCSCTTRLLLLASIKRRPSTDHQDGTFYNGVLVLRPRHEIVGVVTAVGGEVTNSRSASWLQSAAWWTPAARESPAIPFLDKLGLNRRREALTKGGRTRKGLSFRSHLNLSLQLSPWLPKV